MSVPQKGISLAIVKFSFHINHSRKILIHVLSALLERGTDKRVGKSNKALHQRTIGRVIIRSTMTSRYYGGPRMAWIHTNTCNFLMTPECQAVPRE